MITLCLVWSIILKLCLLVLLVLKNCLVCCVHLLIFFDILVLCLIIPLYRFVACLEQNPCLVSFISWVLFGFSIKVICFRVFWWWIVFIVFKYFEYACLFHSLNFFTLYIFWSKTVVEFHSFREICLVLVLETLLFGQFSWWVLFIV